MELTTQRLVLRDLRRLDARDIKENINNLNVSSYLLVVPYPYYMEHAYSFIINCLKEARKKIRKEYCFGIELKSNKKIIGVISLAKISEFEQTAEMGFWLGEKYWRQGIMTEAVEKILKFAFDTLKLRRININAITENKASNYFIKTMGFRFEGTARQSHRSKATGKIHDDNQYGMLKEEWQSKSKRSKY